jgi:hypothetical protein
MVVMKINEQPMILTTILVLFCWEVSTMATTSQVAKEERNESCCVEDLEKDLM